MYFCVSVCTPYFTSRRKPGPALDLKRFAESASNHSNQSKRLAGNPFIRGVPEVLLHQGRDPHIETVLVLASKFSQQGPALIAHCINPLIVQLLNTKGDLSVDVSDTVTGTLLIC